MSNHSQRQAFGSFVKMLFGTPASHIGVPGLKFQISSTFHLAANAHLGRQQMTAQVLGNLPPIWETLSELWAPDFNFVQLGC